MQGTGELDYSEALETFGLRFRRGVRGGPAGTAVARDRRRATTPAVWSSRQVRRDTPAHAAGLNVDDEILAIDDFRVRADRLDNRLEQYQPGDRVSLLVARREQLLRLEVTLGTEPARAWRLEVEPVGSGALDTGPRSLAAAAEVVNHQGSHRPGSKPPALYSG